MSEQLSLKVGMFIVTVEDARVWEVVARTPNTIYLVNPFNEQNVKAIAT